MDSLKKERLERTYEFMGEHKVDVLIAASTDSIQNRGNVRFLTNYPTVYGTSLAILIGDEEPILVVPSGSFQVGWAQRTAWTKKVHAAQNMPSVVGKILEGHKSEIATVALVGFDFLPGSQLEQITFPFQDLNFIDLSSPFRLMKAVKSVLEIGMARESVSLADDAFANLADSTGAGTPETEIFASASHVVYSRGCEDVFLLGSSNPHAVISFPADRALSEGDLLRFSIEPASRGGFWTQTIRTYSVGKPAEDAQAAFDLCKEALIAASDEIRPGKTGGEVANSMIDVLKRMKDGKIGPLGHGMGLDLTEPPYMLPQDRTIIKSGMVITLHPSLARKDIDIWVGDTYLVTERGAENLSEYPNDLYAL